MYTRKTKISDMNKIAVGNRLKSNLDYKSRKVSEAWMSEKYGRVNIVDPYSLNKKQA
jgi:hypothetical protein